MSIADAMSKIFGADELNSSRLEKMKLPPLTELRAFEAAARCRSFKLAAAELGVTPTAVSHQIKLLEAWSGTVSTAAAPDNADLGR
jgi:hypothetical protein